MALLRRGRTRGRGRARFPFRARRRGECGVVRVGGAQVRLSKWISSRRCWWTASVSAVAWSEGRSRRAICRAPRDCWAAPTRMRGRVRRGKQLGRKLGFPTANIAVKRRRVPLQGVFAVRVRGALLPARGVRRAQRWLARSRQPGHATDGQWRADAARSASVRLRWRSVWSRARGRVRRAAARGAAFRVRRTRWCSRCGVTLRQRGRRWAKMERFAPAFAAGKFCHVTDYKNTVNLPQTEFPMKADLAQREPEQLAALGRAGHLSAHPRGARPAGVRAARWTAVRQRRDSPGSCGQQDPEGHHRQGAHARRLRCALCAGLGLPRPADRARRREEARQARPEARCARLSRRLPRVCRDADRLAARRLQAPRRVRRLGAALPDDGSALRGAADPRARQDHRQRASVSRRQARALVPGLPLGARRSGSRVRGSHVDRDRCRVPRCGQR